MKFPRSAGEHTARVARLRCVVSGSPAITIHHAQGGSVTRRLAALGMDSMKGLGRRGYGSALIIPVALEYHSLDGNGIDANVGRASWESLFGEQADFLDEVGEKLGYSLWELHRLWVPASRIYRPPTLNGSSCSPPPSEAVSGTTPTPSPTD